ncbi:uncharacterized protein TEOVI_000051500 [Trypanosoma equiperdum]|uniref:Trypanosome variant surface glycoprotein (A-type) n=1 Tax=Trypanosoma equiperdum TaxID=5694 RepID=A0A1G4I942_TRYEQ|nr:hypothetical protein TEOVI_000051500 [Trypanosoma equiperdum]
MQPEAAHKHSRIAVAALLCMFCYQHTATAARFNAVAGDLSTGTSTTCQLKTVLGKIATHYRSKTASAESTALQARKILRTLPVAAEAASEDDKKRYCALAAYVQAKEAEAQKAYNTYKAATDSGTEILGSHAHFLEGQARLAAVKLAPTTSAANSGGSKRDTPISLSTLPKTKSACTEAVEITETQLQA